MRFLIIALATLTLLSLGCKKIDVKKGTPKCIEKKIKELSKGDLCDSANVAKYTFQGKEVYVFDFMRCVDDGGESVFDASCNSIGFLGGFGGNSKINGDDFSKAVFIERIWQK
jgi:hypothetical protein